MNLSPTMLFTVCKKSFGLCSFLSPNRKLSSKVVLIQNVSVANVRAIYLHILHKTENFSF